MSEETEDTRPWIPKAEVQTKALESKKRSIRRERDRKIGETDYLMAPDYPISDEDRSKVESYRQALRDVPQQDEFPDEVEWPEPPEIEVNRKHLKKNNTEQFVN